MLILHPKIYLDPQGHTTDALLSDGQRVLAVGERARQLARQGRHEQVRPEGACVVPALADAHAHPWGLNQRPGTRSLVSAKDTERVYALLQQWLHESPDPEAWLIATDWDQHAWSDAQQLSLARLDALSGPRPLALMRVDHHALWCNSEALRRAGLSAGEQPTGLLVDEAMQPVLRAMGSTTRQEDEAMLMEYARRLRAWGITCVHQAYMSVARVELLESLRQEGRLPLRVYGMIDGLDADLDALLERGPVRDDQALASTACVKFFADGAMGSRGAMMSDPYLDGTRGMPVTPMSELARRIPQLARRGFQVAVHAIGDQAARELMQIYASVPAADRARVRLRHEHAQVVDDQTLRQLGALGVVASVQFIHLVSDMPWAHRVVGPAQLERLFRWRDLQEVTTLAAGSDAPIDDPHPWRGIAAAMSRQDREGRTHDARQRLTFQEALAAYTTGAAWAAHWERDLGQLHPGYVADMAVLPLDPFEVSPEALRHLWAVQTITSLPQL